MLKCESCLSRFQQVSDLFQHIQSSCLSFYKKHPEHWAEILSKMTGPVESTDKDPEQSSKTDHAQDQAEEVSEANTAKKPPQSNPTKKEVPFCIMFKAQKVKKGQPVLSLQMTVSDYYYGTVDGKRIESKQVSRACKCSDCGKSLRNNIRFMSHLRHKILNRREKKEGTDARNICNHCFREYSSPFLLQCHLENVHGTVAASTTCKICDCHYPTDRELLGHMKDVHMQNEAPYSCKLCAYRSSFYNDVTNHFREKHASSTGLMCPFCLFIAMSANAFSKHVLQHVKKGFACSRCRLIFNTTSERQTHQDTDHVSQHMKEKMTKYKNSHLCQIYVKAAPYKDDSNDITLQSDSERHLSGSGAPKVLKRELTELPAYLCPAKRSNCVRKIRMTDESPIMDIKCLECGEVLKSDSVGLRNHFRYQHECKWCVHVTSCEQASHGHVLREHANAEMREQIFGKNDKEDTPFPIILQDDEDDDTLSKIKEEPQDVLPTIPGWGSTVRVTPPTWNTSQTPVSTKTEPDSQDTSPPAKARRKQSNPTKIPDFVRPILVSKPIRRDRCVQTKGLEKDKGVQACDQDFQNLHGNVDQLGAFTLDPKGKVKKCKVSAQPGYTPDLEDDAGWAKYFASVENDPVLGKPKSQVKLGNEALPTMVPRQGTFSILNKALKAHHTGSGSENNEKEQNKSTGSHKQMVSTASGKIAPPLGILRTAPLAPNKLRCVEVTHDHMLVQWDPPSNGAVTQYKIVFQGLGPQTVQILPVQQTLVKLVGLKPNVMYSVRVYTFFYTGVSDYANMFVKTKPGPSASGPVKSLTMSQISSAKTGATSTNSEINLPRSANTGVTQSNVQYKTSVGVPFSTYLALKSAAINSVKSTTNTGVSNVSVYSTGFVSSMPKTIAAEIKNGTPGHKSMIDNSLVTAKTATTGSSQIQRSNVSLVKSTAISFSSKDVALDPDFKNSVPTVSTTKDESNDVYLVLDDEDEKPTTSGGPTGAFDNANSSKAKTTVQSCVTMNDGDVIMVLGDNDGSMSVTHVRGKSLMVNKKQSLHVDTDVSMSSQSDSHEERSIENIEKKSSVADSTLKVTDECATADVGIHDFVNASSASDSSTSTDIALEAEVDEAPIDIQVVSIENCENSKESIANKPNQELKDPHEADKSYSGICKEDLPVEEDGSSLTLKNPEDTPMNTHTDQEMRENGISTTKKEISEQMDNETEGCIIISKKSLKQKDQDNVTDTPVGPCPSRMQEGDETQVTSELLSVARKCDAPLVGTEESVSAVDRLEVAMPGEDVDAIPTKVKQVVMNTNFGLEENESGEMENCALPGKSVNLNSLGDQLLPGTVAYLNATRIAPEDVSNPVTPTVESIQGTGPILSLANSERSVTAGNLQQKVLDMSEMNESEPGLLKNNDTPVYHSVLSTDETVQNTIEHIDTMPTSEMKLQDGDRLHGNALHNVETMTSDCSQQEKQTTSISPDADENLAELSGADLIRPGIGLDNIDELLNNGDMFWL